MSRVWSVAVAEWQLWLRSKVATVAFGVIAALLAIASLSTAAHMSEERHARTHQQQQAEETFLAQPARHPHRMVHYGHYVFRTPPPLSIIDPGVDAVTGQSIFLEGHRQNTAMFADIRASASLGGFPSLSPAFVYQVLTPLLLIALGHAVFVREREAGTLSPLLAQGVSGHTLFVGKVLALAALSVAILLPIAVLAFVGLVGGEAIATSLALVGINALYLLVWSAVIALVSAVVKTRSLALGLLVFIWLAWVLVIPRIAVATTSAALPVTGKIESDFQMYADMRELGDGHNAADPAFAELRNNLLAEYDVASVEELPINFRGVVAQASEQDLTTLMNQYAERRMAAEAEQTRRASAFGWLSPTMALGTGSRTLAGVDLLTHHRFLREAEIVRYDFVQGLNQVHIDELSYADDVNRSASEAASRQAQVSPENWAVLSAFQFEPAPPRDRIGDAVSPIAKLLLWLMGLLAVGLGVARRLAP
ncbi:MAG: DUF3526 domain-containing protein [Pseudomonadota bacterium]